MNKMIADQQQRDEALDPSRSFIVQAPAGSGKTELLTRRFLKLLSIVEKDPEEILAITFTRKAAAEMRARIIQALKKPEQSELAQAALKRNEELNWHLIENPNRLRIQTVDAFCKQIVNHAPILSRFGCSNNIAEDSSSLYEEAALATLNQIDDAKWSQAIETVLSHLDNRYHQASQLLSTILSKREQWLPLIMKMSHHEDPRNTLEKALFTINRDILKSIHELFPQDFLNELITLVQFSQTNCNRCQCDASNLLNPVDFQDRQSLETFKSTWMAITNLLLTDKNGSRTTVDKRIGFPNPKEIKNSEERIIALDMKTRMRALLDDLSLQEELRETLASLRNAPPFAYTSQQWSILKALIKLLPLAVGHLKLIFQSKSVTDFIEVAEAARNALGTPETPTDLALKLDYKIRHILFDEFQDTSTAQFDLLKQLSEGWEPNDGRTLFIVGDPMQSIYRFRNAEVGLFLKAQQEGIGNLSLTPLELSVNFRSDPAIIQWINDVGQQMFPHYENIDSGAVAYNAFSMIEPSVNNTSPPVYIHSTPDHAEAKQILDIIHDCQRSNPNESIAILVRARNHLTNILKLLRENHIAYQAVEIDPLESRTIIQDLFALTKALLHFGDRIAWLSILRAPWCGLSLQDLHTIANQDENKTIWELIHLSDIDKQLTQDGYKRLHKLINVITNGLATRHQFLLRDWIETVWKDLDGHRCLQQPSDIEDAEIFFNLIETYETAGDILDFNELDKKIGRLFAAPDTSTPNAIQVMTIHKAKGLEFDTVILPSLESKSPPHEPELLLWMERTRSHTHKDLILAPIKSAEHQEDAIYQYVAYEHNLKSKHESVRLLYVALTRAKHRLHLLGCLRTKNPSEGSFLKLLWPEIEKHFAQDQTNDEDCSSIETPQTPERKLRRLPLSYFDFDHSKQITVTPFIQKDELASFETSQLIATTIGTCVHHIFEQIAQEGLDQWSDDRIQQLIPHWKMHLLELLLPQNELDSAIEQVVMAVQNILSDEKGHWILSPHHDAHSEFEITFNQNGSMHRYVMDRMFVDDDGTLWIIDYKTGSPSDDDIALYREQLYRYAHAMQKLHQGPIRCVLYFPMSSSFQEII